MLIFSLTFHFVPLKNNFLSPSTENRSYNANEYLTIIHFTFAGLRTESGCDPIFHTTEKRVRNNEESGGMTHFEFLIFDFFEFFSIFEILNFE